MTRQGLVTHPQFFSGLLTRAAPAAAWLLGVADVAKARYFGARPTGIVRDPAVTCRRARNLVEASA
ncbi:hypothetical protein [Nonomuraea sp. NPDC046570]|uniref:hypothetical protein n=1 Tax=Nonomuraea sp. NPDC046570 TaxID=3155255 RepID=UPI0033C92F7E